MIKILRRTIRAKPKNPKPQSRLDKTTYAPIRIETPDRNLYELMQSKSLKLLSKYPVLLGSRNNLKILSHYYKGCDVTVCGSENYTYNTARDLVELFEEKSPIQFILDMNTETLKSYTSDIFKHEPIISVSFDSLLGRQQAFQFLCNDIYLTNTLIKDPEEPVILQFKEKQQNISADTNLTAMYTASLFSIAKSFFARPPELLLLEDMALNFDVSYLKHIYYEVLKNLNKENIPEGPILPLNKEAILNDVKSNTQTLFGKTLYKKKALFQCAVMERFARSSEKALLHTDYDQVAVVSKLM